MIQKKVEEHNRPEGQSVKDAIRVAAVQLFSEYGYHAAPLRDIARIAGIQAASIYYHYANKEALLVEIMETYMLLLNTSLERILQEQVHPLPCLYKAIENHIRLHTTYKSEFFIIDTEIRALEGENRSHILSLRDHYEALVQEILHAGMVQHVFRQSDVKVASYAIIAMCTEVSNWFRPDGRLSVQQVIDMYSSMITQGLLVDHIAAQKPEESERT
jgi:AcrR family transcriptional regulator